MKTLVCSLIEGDVTIQIPDPISEESFDTLMDVLNIQWWVWLMDPNSKDRLVLINLKKDEHDKDWWEGATWIRVKKLRAAANTKQPKKPRKPTKTPKKQRRGANR